MHEKDCFASVETVERIREFVRMWGWVIALGVGGVGLLGYGLWEQIRPREVKVEIVSGESANQQFGDSAKQIVVDVAGAVEAPGVYKLPSGSRMGDALVAAGGLSAGADRVWVAQNLNLAEPIKDGGKVYIPDKSANQIVSNSADQQASKSVNQTGKININTASESELDSLPGIGSVRAAAIITNRPYGSVEELVSKAKIPQSVYEDIVSLVSVY